MEPERTVVLTSISSVCTACGQGLPGNGAARLCDACAAAAFADAVGEEGFHIPGYADLMQLSRGGMGIVYRARQLRPERSVAIKVLLTHFAEDVEMQARFQIEARAMAALNHPGILPVYEVGEVDGMPFFSMKLAAGGTLAQLLTKGPLPPRKAATLMAALCRALHSAHQHGVIHRDLKPENFLFDDDDRAYISDFGLAKLTVTAPADSLTKTESFFGTPHYMPPEIAGGKVTDAGTPADIYSMGAVLYQCLSGKRPYASQENLAALLRAISSESAPTLRSVLSSVPRDLEVICARAMERTPAARYASAAEMADDLERWLEGRPIRARPVGAAESLWRWARRHPLPATLAAALFITLLTGGILLAMSNRQRGALLTVANERLRTSLLEQARSERLLGRPGHRQRSLNFLRQAAAIAPSPLLRDEAAAVLTVPDVREVSIAEAGGPVAETPGAWPVRLEENDDAASQLISPGKAWALSFHGSGRAAVWRAGATTPEKIWEPPPGRIISGGLLPDGQGAILADAADGLLRLAPDSLAVQVLAPPGDAAVSSMAIDPSGQRIALGLADGLAVRDGSNGKLVWEAQGEPARCAPVWSPDSSVLVAVTGAMRGVQVLDSDTGTRILSFPASGWPLRLAMHPQGTLIACAADDHVITVAARATGRIWAEVSCEAEDLRFTADGRHLLAGGRAWLLESPAALREWQATGVAGRGDDTVFSLALSPNGRRLLTTATGGVRVWSVEQGVQTGFHPAENQRIDAPTAAWWLDDSRLLVQVPGGLEEVPVDTAGATGISRPVSRPPGANVVRVDAAGTWLVRLVDEDEREYFESWPNGDAKRASKAAAPPAAASPDGVVLEPDGTLLVRRPAAPLRLTPPSTGAPRSMVLAPDGSRLFVLAAGHRVFEWNLDGTEQALAAAGFPPAP